MTNPRKTMRSRLEKSVLKSGVATIKVVATIRVVHKI
jgi:hypothetical protein